MVQDAMNGYGSIQRSNSQGNDSWALKAADFIQVILLTRTPVPGSQEARQTLVIVEGIYRKSAVSPQRCRAGLSIS
jgi:hypothetical protein